MIRRRESWLLCRLKEAATEGSGSKLSGAAKDKEIYGADFFVILLFIKGVTVTGGHARVEGVTGHFNPAELEGPAIKDCVVRLPGLEEELLAKIYCIALFSTVALLVCTAPMERRNANLLLQPPTIVQEGAGVTTAMRATKSLSALTSALLTTGRA